MIRRIALVLPTFSPLGGGVSEAARLHVKALSKAGFDEITVHALDQSEERVDWSQWQPARTFRHRSFGPKSYSFAPGMLASLLRAKPDLVHVHGVWQFQAAATHAWSLMTGKPYVVSPHGMLEPWIRARSPKLKSAVSGLYQNSFLRRAAGYHLLTDKEGSDVAEFLSGQPSRIIPNFAEPFHDDGHMPAWFRPEFEGRDIYLFLGRIHEKKGCMELMEAWENLSVADPGFRDRSALVFCGWNDGIEGFEERALGLDARFGNVLFAGPQYGTEKHRSMGAATFFLLPSKSEGLPMAVLEAWAAGKPAILSPECNLPIGFERNAAIRCGFTPETIRPALKAAHALSADARGQMAGAARQLVADHYSEQSVREGLLALYDDSCRWKERA
ncbi:MAG: hypothetical protein RLZZ444_738 [Pseudomonadota bacterium]|jgi:glycosyltransferase involved in cell wall biosynthesis